MGAGETVWAGGCSKRRLSLLKLFLEIVLLCNKMLSLAVHAPSTLSHHPYWESRLEIPQSGGVRIQNSAVEAMTHTAAPLLPSWRP